MPELPEVETSRRGIEPHLVGATILHAVVRNGRLRWPVSEEIYRLSDVPVLSVRRRAKYLLLELPDGWIIIHLGMSGSLRILSEELPAEKHDHVDDRHGHHENQTEDDQWSRGDTKATAKILQVQAAVGRRAATHAQQPGSENGRKQTSQQRPSQPYGKESQTADDRNDGRGDPHTRIDHEHTPAEAEPVERGTSAHRSAAPVERRSGNREMCHR